MRPDASWLRRHSGVAIGLIAQALQYGSALLLLPFIVTQIPAAEVGIWYICVTMQGLVVLADFGFQPTLARSFAAAFSGASELRPEGLGEGKGSGADYALAAQLLFAARRLYLALAALLLVLLLTAGSYYVTYVARGQVSNLGDVQFAWAVFAVGISLNIYLLWISPLLLGAGRAAENYMYVVAARGGFAVLGIMVLTAGGGLLSLAIVNLLSGALAWVLAVRLVRPVLDPLQKQLQTSRSSNILPAVWPNASRMGLVALGAFLITRYSVLVLSTFAGLTVSASYAVSLQLLSALTAVAQLPMQVALPQMVAARIQRDRDGLRHLFLTRQMFFLVVFASGVLVLVLAGATVLRAIGSTVTLLPTPLLLLLGLVLFLEGNHANCAFVITTANRVPFVAPALLSGVAVALVSTAAAWAGAGAMGVIAAQGVVQLAYNNWKWPLMLAEELRR